MQLQFPSKNGNEGNKSLHKRSFRSCLPSWIFPGVSVLRSGQILKEGFFYLFSFLKFAVYQGLGLRLFLKMRNGVVFRLPHHFPVRTMAQLLNSDWNSDRNISKAWTIWKVMGRALAKCKKILMSGNVNWRHEENVNENIFAAQKFPSPAITLFTVRPLVLAS